MRTSLRFSAAAAAATLLLGGLSACNDDSDKGAEPSSKNTIFQKSGDDDSSDAASEGAGDDATAGLTEGQSLTKDEVLAIMKASSSTLTTAHVQMDMDVSANGQKSKMTAEGDLRAKPLAEALTMDLGSGMTMEMRLVGNAMYMKAAMLPSKDKWIKMDLSDLGAMGLGSLTDSLADPMAMAEKSAKHIKTATYVGEEDLAGGTAKHYRMTVDVDGLLKEMKIPSTGGVQTPKSATQEFWLDEQGRVVKMTQDMAPLETMTMTMSDFGKKVDIKAPPASQVVDKDQAGLGGLGG